MKSELMAKIGLCLSAVSLAINLLLILYLTCWWFPPLGYTSVGRTYLDNGHCYYDSDCLDDCHASYSLQVEFACYRQTCYCKYRSFLNSKSLLI